MFWLISRIIKAIGVKEDVHYGSDWYQVTYIICLFRRFTVAYYCKHNLWEGLVDEQIYTNWRPLWNPLPIGGTDDTQV